MLNFMFQKEKTSNTNFRISCKRNVNDLNCQKANKEVLFVAYLCLGLYDFNHIIILLEVY